MTEYQDSSREPSARRRPSIRVVLIVIAAVLSIILVLQNTESVETKIFFATLTMPRAVLLVVTFLLGMLVGRLVPALRNRSSAK